MDKTSKKVISGQIIDIDREMIFAGKITIENGIIKSIEETATADNQFILPGFIDAHVHIESSMLIPTEFAKMAVVHGTVATVSDPHEIANVCGLDGVKYMINNGRQTPFKFYFGAPSCVPATSFETAGAVISPADIEALLQLDEVKYLAEMMNWPAVLTNDPEVLEKIAIAQKLNKPIDGHAPGLIGKQASQYAAAGISTDHECFTIEEARAKLALGMKILIREGSAAKNFEALIDLLRDHENDIMFCSDDKHPDSLLIGHIDELVRRALQKGHSLFKVLKAACINPVEHYKLDVGLLRVGDAADFIIVNNLDDFSVEATYLEGELVARNGETLLKSVDEHIINNFNCAHISESEIRVEATGNQLAVIEALDGQLITRKFLTNATQRDGAIVSDEKRDILKIVVKNRYQNQKPAVAFIKNFGLKSAAIASTIAHDSHNIIAVGSSDQLICQAINKLIECKGGISFANDKQCKVLPLPVAGIMTTQGGQEVARLYSEIDQLAKSAGSKLGSPYMTLSFMALLVIPELKLSDKGLFDGALFKFTDSVLKD